MSQPLAVATAETHRADRADTSMRLPGHDLRVALADVADGLRLVGRTELSRAKRRLFDHVRGTAAGLAPLPDAARASGMPAAPEPLPERDARRVLDEIAHRWVGRAIARRRRFRARTGEDLGADLWADLWAARRGLCDAIHAGDLDRVQRHAHVPAGRAATFGDGGPEGSARAIGSAARKRRHDVIRADWAGSPDILDRLDADLDTRSASYTGKTCTNRSF